MLMMLVMCYDLMCAWKLARDQLSLAHSTKVKHRHAQEVRRVSPVRRNVEALQRKGFVEKMSFEPGVEERMSDGWWQWWWRKWRTDVSEIRWEWQVFMISRLVSAFGVLLTSILGLDLAFCAHFLLFVRVSFVSTQCSSLSGKSRLWNDLLYVSWDVELYWLTASISHRRKAVSALRKTDRNETS